MIKKTKFMLNGVLLTGTTLISSVIGLIFRVYMTNIIGTQGIGIYELIVTVYIFFVGICTSGVSLAVTRLTTDALAQSCIKKAVRITRICCAISACLGFSLGFLLYFSAPFIGNCILQSSETVISLQILSFGLPFLSVSACYRGYFFARRTIVKTASEQLIEQLIEILIFALLIGFMAPYGIKYACAAVVIGTACSEILTFFYSFALYACDTKKLKRLCEHKRETCSLHSCVKSILLIGVPVTLSTALRCALKAAENILIPIGLKANGASSSFALSAYGTITGLVFPLIVFPCVFLRSYSVLLIPEMSEANIKTGKGTIKHITEKVLRFSFLFSLPIAVLLYFFADSIGGIIYNSDTVSGYLCIFAPIVPLIYIDCVVDGMLKGLNEQVHYLIYNIADAVLRTALIFFLLPIYGVKGLIAVIFISAIFNGTLCMSHLLKVTQVKINFADCIFKPLLAIFLPCLCVTLLNKLNLIILNDINGIFAAVLCGLCYILILMVINVIKVPVLKRKPRII